MLREVTLLRLIGFIIIGFLATIGLYTLLNSNEKDIKKAKDKIERVYDAAKKEFKK